MLLVGDIGGTKTALAILSPQSGPRDPLKEATLPSADYASLEALAEEFLGQSGLEVTDAVFAVAGPVVEGRVEVTNLPWVIEAQQVREALGLSSVALLNDLEAIALAVPHLSPDDLETLNEGQPAAEGAMAVIAPGTGLGEAYLTWDGDRYVAHASEGGHASFAPSGAMQIDLLRHLRDHFDDHVSFERVCSGPGIRNIYAFLKESGRAVEPPWLAKRLVGADDPAPVITAAALDDDERCDICRATVDIFASILGAEAGNLALKVLATGGIYVGGGVPRHVLPVLKQGRFLEAFQGKGRLADLLARMPVHVILTERAALLGAAHQGLEL